MQGLIFQELREFIKAKFGSAFWEDIRKQAGVETTMYTPVQAYPDQELLALIRALSERVEQPVPSMLETFGRFFVPHFLKTRPHLVDPKWDYLDFFLHAPEMLQQMEKRRLPGSEPAVMICTRDAPDQLTMRYSSKRRLCGFIRGVMLGVADHYHVHVKIEEPRCVFKGNAECVLVLKVVP